MSEFRVIYVRRRKGGWTATVKEVPGCRVQGRTIREARLGLRESLGASIDAERVDFLEDVKVSAPIRRLLVRHAAARRRAEQERARAQAMARKAVQALVKDLRLGIHDTGELLGLSVQRVQQLLRQSD